MTVSRILVVDDEPLVLKAVQVALSGCGYALETAGDARDALKKFDASPFDVVVTDLRLPGMQGDALAQEIKRRKPAQRVFMLTAFPPTAPPDGCDLVLEKPSGLADLCRVIAGLARADS